MFRLIALNDLSRHIAPPRDALQAAFTRVMNRGRFAFSPARQGLEAQFAAHLGLRHAVGVANGTDAIELAPRGAGTVAGDEVILTLNSAWYAATSLVAMRSARH